MGYLITQIIICLLIAALIGFIIGWLLRGLGCHEQDDYQKPESVSGNASTINTLSSATKSDDISPIDNSFSGKTASDDTSTINTLSAAGAMAGVGGTIAESMAKVQAKYHKIEEIEGIGKSLGNHLRNIGVKTTGDLIDKCSTDDGFQQVVKTTSVTDLLAKQWVRMADLMRIPNVDGQYAELMEASGIQSVQDLTGANADSLTTEMKAVNNREHTIPDSIPLPDANMVANWIRDAKDI